MEAGIAFAWRHAYDHDAGYLSSVPFFFRGRWYVYSRGIFINSRLSTILLIFPILFRYVKRVSCKDLKIRMK